MPERRTLITAMGTNPSAFKALDWGLLVTAAMIWGASFLFIAIGLDSFSPGVVTFLRLAFGAFTLAWFRASRTPIPRQDWGRVWLLGLVWMGLPLTLFPIAQQWITSSLAGMLNAAVPIPAAIIAAALLRAIPGRAQIVGLLIGLAGVIAVGLPSLSTSGTQALGTGLVLLAVTCYGLATNLAVPLQQRYGALPVLFRSQLAALVMVTPFALFDIPNSGFSVGSLGAVVALGVLGTALAFVAMTNLVGRVGATRGTIAIYFMPIVAIALGVAVRSETIHPVSIVGTGLVIVGAYFASRSEA